MNNAKKRSGTASFKSSIERQVNKPVKGIAPPIGFYDYDISAIEGKKQNSGLDLMKRQGRAE